MRSVCPVLLSECLCVHPCVVSHNILDCPPQVLPPNSSACVHTPPTPACVHTPPGLGKAQIKLLFGTEEAYDKYVEALSLVDGVQQRESVAAKFRHQLFDNFPGLAASVADGIFDAEIQEFRLKREVSRLHFGNARAQRLNVASPDQRLAMLAAGSMQPVVRSLIEAALKNRTPHNGMSSAQLMNKSLDKRIARPSGAQVFLKDQLCGDLT